uniref:Vps39_2 domain-containing protein n=1 Tax=Rhabditophanes sp. KR3021 TaxID=114890 RepID=A0AC35UG33_9BILA
MFATNRSIFYLDALPNLDKNIEYLRKEKQYEHAIELIQTYLPDKVKNIQELKFEMAMHCFQHKQFKKCFDILKEVQHDVIIVLYCFRAFLPEYDAPDELKHVNPESDTVIGESEKLPEKDNREFLKQLIDYLQDVRTINYELLRNNDKYKENNEEGKLLSDFEKKKILRILEISDTTIIQCYVHTEPFLIASKLRVSNFCNMVVTQKLLEKSQLFNDLFLLYKTRRKYQEAVELLIQQYSKESHMKSIENVVLYLQELGIFQIDLIFKYADWVFSKNFESGLQIFTDATDYHEVKTLDRKRVLEYFISSRHIEAVLPYLEHIVFTWKDPNPEFHESLGDHYIAHIKMNKIEYVHACSDDDTRIVAGHEEGEFGRLRRQLIRFLNESSTYNPNKMLTKLQGDYFYEEKAIVYGKLGKHKEALCILVTILMEYNEADAYCSKYYDPSVPKHSQIYSLLFEAYVKPFKTNIVDYSNTLNVERKADVGKALQILQKHCDKIDSVKAIELLPNDIPLTDLWPALSSVMKSRITQNEHSTLKLGIEKSIFTTMNAELTERRKQKIKIGFDDECNLCHQKISTSALACKEDGTLLDYSCFLKQKKQKQ